MAYLATGILVGLIVIAGVLWIFTWAGGQTEDE